MTRSLSFTYLFVILAVGYLGGALLFRKMPVASVEKMLTIFDVRVVAGQDANFIWPVLMTIAFFFVVFLLAHSKRTRMLVFLFGALKCVVFGLASGYLLSTGMNLLTYTVWWFPFQLIISFVLLIFCAILTPPFFVRTMGRRQRNDKALIILFVGVIIVLICENLLFYMVLK